MRLRVMLFVTGLAIAAAASVSAADSTGAATPSVGAPAPSFSLTSDEGKPTRLEDFRGKWVVLYFYPKDFTSGCTLEAHNFQEDLAKYQAANAVVVGVSVDSADSHKSFCAKEGLNFRLLSDPDAKVSTTYGSVMEYEGKKLSARNTFLIDPSGKLVKVYTGVKPATHSAEVLAELATLSSKKS